VGSRRRSSETFEAPVNLLVALLAAAAAVLLDNPRQALTIPTPGLRVLVLERNDSDPAEWKAIRDAGANVVATLRPPSAEADALATANGLTYLAFLTTDEIPLFLGDAARVGEARGERSLVGFYYWDAGVTEGFTSPDAQQHAYSTLKLAFPDKLVLYPTRLDLIVSNPEFLDRYFRPEYTDLVTPYFYPVGTTPIGEAHESDPWRLDEILAVLATRVPAGKDLLPVLQGFEQNGYPVSPHFLGRQFAIFRKHWPSLANAAVYAWRFGPGEPGPLVEVAGRPDLEAGVCNLFRALSRRSSCRSQRVVSGR
jgi:hypothetical protein